MATAPAEDDKGTAGQPKKHDHQQAAHLDKVTDYVEEQEIKADMGKVEPRAVPTRFVDKS